MHRQTLEITLVRHHDLEDEQVQESPIAIARHMLTRWSSLPHPMLDMETYNELVKRMQQFSGVF